MIDTFMSTTSARFCVRKVQFWYNCIECICPGLLMPRPIVNLLQAIRLLLLTFICRGRCQGTDMLLADMLGTCISADMHVPDMSAALNETFTALASAAKTIASGPRRLESAVRL